MKTFRPTRKLALWLLAGAMPLAGGCRHHYYLARELYQPPPAVAPLSTISDPIWQSQEARAEASEFVLNMVDFEYQSPMLNHCGKSHVTQIAARLQYCPNMPVVIEPSMGAVDEETQFKYPVHPDPELDLKRREMVVLALTEMGVHDADKRVVVAPAWAEAFTATEATQVYNQALSGAGQFGFGGFGFGGFGSSFGGGFGFTGF